MENGSKAACLMEQYDNEAALKRYQQSVTIGYGGVGRTMDIAYFEEIGKFLTKDTVLLDVGCSEGEFLLSEICRVTQNTTSKFSVRPKQVLGVDCSALSLEAFRKRLADISKPDDFPDVRLFQSDMRTLGKLNLPPCDMILSRYVLNHMQSVEEMKSCFRQLKAVLNSDGHLVIMANAYESVEMPPIFEKLPRGNLVPIMHPPDVKLVTPAFSISEFVYAFRAAGFTVKKLVAIDGWKTVIQDKFTDGEPFPREKVTPLTIIVTCVPSESN